MGDKVDLHESRPEADTDEPQTSMEAGPDLVCAEWWVQVRNPCGEHASIGLHWDTDEQLRLATGEHVSAENQTAMEQPESGHELVRRFDAVV